MTVDIFYNVSLGLKSCSNKDVTRYYGNNYFNPLRNVSLITLEKLTDICSVCIRFACSILIFLSRSSHNIIVIRFDIIRF